MTAMEHETLFTASKWDILKRLESGPASPLELSNLCSTSIANVSQQLRLLEMAGLVTSRRISNRDKGKPRILYSLTGNVSYLIAATGQFVEKRVMELSEYNKVIMRVWFFEQRKLHYTLEKSFWKIEEHLPKISFLGVDPKSENPVVLHVKTSLKSSELKPFTVTDPLGVTRQVIFSTDLSTINSLYILHDPQGLALENKNSHKKNTKGDGQ